MSTVRCDAPKPQCLSLRTPQWSLPRTATRASTLRLAMAAAVRYPPPNPRLAHTETA